MKGSFTVKKLQPKKSYYVSDKDYDSRLGGEFNLFIRPFPIDDENAFYYVRRLLDGQIEIEGEGYIVTAKERLNHYKADARREFAGNRIWYYWLDEAGNTIYKEGL